MDDQSLIGDRKMVIEMISDQVPKLIGDQFDQPSNVHGKNGPKCLNHKPMPTLCPTYITFRYKFSIKFSLPKL